VAGAAVPVAPARGGPTLGDCQHLLRQFDVAWTTHRDSPRAEGARRSRDQGEAECREGHYADGVHHLRRALHDIGLKPVKRVAHPAAR
jgi:hypothetical protein